MSDDECTARVIRLLMAGGSLLWLSVIVLFHVRTVGRLCRRMAAEGYIAWAVANLLGAVVFWFPSRVPEPPWFLIVLSAQVWCSTGMKVVLAVHAFRAGGVIAACIPALLFKRRPVSDERVRELWAKTPPRMRLGFTLGVVVFMVITGVVKQLMLLRMGI